MSASPSGSLSDQANVEEASAALCGFGGVVARVGAGGGVVSIRQVKEVAPLVAPPESFASTEKVCDPELRPL